MTGLWWVIGIIASVAFIGLWLRLAFPELIYGVRKEILFAKAGALKHGRYNESDRAREWKALLRRDLQFEHSGKDAQDLLKRASKLREMVIGNDDADDCDGHDLACMRELAMLIEAMGRKACARGSRRVCVDAEEILIAVCKRHATDEVNADNLEATLKEVPASGVQIAELLIATLLWLAAGAQEKTPAQAATGEPDVGV